MNQMCISLKLGGWYMWSAVWRPGVPEPSRPLRLPFLSFYCPTPDFSNVAVHPQLARLGTVLEPHLPQIMSELKAWFLLGSLSDHIGTYFFCGPKLMWSYVKLGIVKFQIRQKNLRYQNDVYSFLLLCMYDVYISILSNWQNCCN
jgi:hypothetical protein